MNLIFLRDLGTEYDRSNKLTAPDHLSLEINDFF